MTKKKKIIHQSLASKWQFKLVLAISFLAVGVATYDHITSAAVPAYITLYFGRSGFVETNASCVPYQNTVSLQQVADGLKTRGISGVGGLVMDYTGDTQLCKPWYSSDGAQQGQAMYTSWADAANLRDNYGWNFISQSKSYNWMTNWTTDEQRKAESCDTLQTLQAHGHTRGQGMFAYPDNKFDAASEAVVTSCFNYGRKYGGGKSTQTSSSSYPYWLNTRSINGGQCNNSALPCYTMPVVNNRRYALPSSIALTLKPKAGQYSIVQFYRFVTGVSQGEGPTWDCTSTNPADHYTSAPELYCIDDFYAAVDGRNKAAIVTNPEAVAKSWGRPF